MKHVLVPALFALLPGLAIAQSQEPAAKPAPAAIVVVETWPLTTCVVSGKPLEEGKAKTFQVDGQTFRTCCGKCQKKVEAAPAEYAAKVAAARQELQRADYPLADCVVSGKPLTERAHDVMVGDTLVRVCCGRCERKLKSDPTAAAAMVAKVREARVAAQEKGYPLTTCPISGHQLKDDAVDVLVGTTLVKLCCKDCLADLQKDPEGVAAKVVAARAHGTQQAEPGAAKAGASGGACCSDGSGDCCESGAGGDCCNESKPAKDGTR